MKYTVIGNTNVKISQIGLGTWQFGSKGWGYGTDFTRKDAISIVHKALELGINVIDTAEAYGRGKSEEIIGEAIKGYDRERIIITTKFLPIAIRPSSVVKALNKSLKRLQTDYIDIYLIHWPAPWLIGRVLNHMERMVDEGLIRFIGISNFNLGRLRKAQKKMYRHRIQVNQVNYSLARNQVENDLLPYTQREKITVMAYSPLGQGWLTGKYTAGNTPGGTRRRNRLFRSKNFKRGEQLLSLVKEIAEDHQVTMAQVALNWVIRNSSVIAIPGVKNLAQLEGNIGSADFELANDEIDRIKKTLKEFHPRLLM
ncbi:MAG: aldo/keto reductase [Candidatus Heimdallarchaeota archaeon]|nr:MAG: aldo/keto reductase [Candidatus Heimdallarchaeota archaeon]